MRVTRIAYRAKRKNISGRNAMSLQDQIPGQDVTRQVAIEVQDFRSIRDDSPKDSNQQNVLNPREKKTRPFHKDDWSTLPSPIKRTVHSNINSAARKYR